MSDMDPEAAAAFATGEGEASGLDAGSLDASGSPSEGPISRLFDGDADGPSVQEIEADYGVEKAPAITLRGVLRVATGSGIPPAAEILLGGFMWVMQADSGGGDAENEGVGIDIRDHA